MTNQVQFSAFNFKSSQVRVIVDPNQEFWFGAKDVCDILGYVNDTDAIKKHCKEKGVAKRYSPTKGGNQELTFINEPNLYRLIIKSRKPEAEKFEAWVFEEVLPQIRKTGKYALQNSQQNLPLAPPPKKYTFDFTEDELQSLVWAWFAFVRGIYTFRHIYPAFEKLGSNMAGEIYGQGFEYSHTAQSAHKILERITKDFDCDPMTNWRVLKHVRGFDPAFKKPTF
ncbi:Bro-N domain-containing protein [Mannheimia sp. AT1]|uniref:Bro-N domain-containing protein n=1 Tax=Mannheimia cairinae TaxID=3025936 RepID=A0ABT5MUP3_9PAST|nr:Bro-N domain-containing protein [Mannheimia cairinae]MDD0824617.1 Bro-N domain-containing protein [Mannheimia cairinae]